MAYNTCFGDGLRNVEGTPTGVSKVTRKTSIVKFFDPLSSLKLKTDSKFCNDSILKSDDKAEILWENGAFNYLDKDKTDALEKESLYMLALPENLTEPLTPVILYREKFEPIKKYTEADFSKILKAQEIVLQKKFSQKLCEYKKNVLENDKNRMLELTELVAKSKRYNVLISEVFSALEEQNTRLKYHETKLNALKIEKELLKSNIDNIREDQNNAENAFTEIHSRYETSKSMIKCYKENIEHLNQSIGNMHKVLDEYAVKYKMLESRTQDLLNKTTKEAENTKKNVENEIVCLTADLKREQIKMRNLENEFVRAKSINDELCIRYKDLIAKLSI